jgi:serine/threonine-protein kinase
VDELTAKLIAGTEDSPAVPFFSPDGKWIGYRSGRDSKLKKIAIGGGAPVVLCDAPTLLGAHWEPDNTIVYGSRGNGIMRVSANGGTPECIVKQKSGALLLPQILPGGESVLYTIYAGLQNSIAVQSLKSEEPRVLFAGVGAKYLPTGHIVYGVENDLCAISLDPNKLEVAGGSASIVSGVFRITAPQYALSDSGTLVYIPGTTAEAPTGRSLVWADKNGKEEPLGAPPNNYFTPRISPDGTRVALAVLSDNFDIWIWDLVRKTLTRLTLDKSNELQPVWTPDSKRIVFSTDRDGPYGIYWKAADGTGKEEKLVGESNRSFQPYSLSRDGKMLVMDAIEGILNPSSVKLDIGILSMEGERVWKPLLKEDYVETQAQISPDGRWMAYVSTESGRNEVYIRPFPEVDKGKWQVSTSGGASARWSPGGRELLYLSADNSVMTIAVKTQPAFSLGTPKILFKSIYAGTTTTSGTPWDIHADGKRFLMMKMPGADASAGSGPRKINIVLNWTEELKQRVPVR